MMKKIRVKPCAQWADKLAARHPDDLSAAEIVALRQHLLTCVACASVYQSYMLMESAIRALPIGEPVAALPMQVLPKDLETVAARQAEKQAVTGEYIAAEQEGGRAPQRKMPVHALQPARPWLHMLEQGLAALVILGILFGWLAISHLPRSKSGSPAPFSDAHALPLGAPVLTTQGNFTGAQEWSADSRIFVTMQMNTQQHKLEAHRLDIASGHTLTYPVLDSSWTTAMNSFDSFQVLLGRYLLAERMQGKNLATLVIWDIVGQRAITTRTLPSQGVVGGQVLTPWIVPSKNEQTFAMFSLDGTLTIWDVASGQKLVTCEGKALHSIQSAPTPTVKWYNHDQSLLLFDSKSGQLEGWNTQTGMRLFSLNNIGIPTNYNVQISPDNKYMALFGNNRQTTGTLPSDLAGAVEILDAHSGQLLQSYHRQVPNGEIVNFAWMPDSKRLLITSMDGSSSHPSRMQIDTLNVFTGQTTLVTFFSQTTLEGPTPDNRYLILGSPDGRSMQIWRTSDGRQVATVTTPGVYARMDAFYYYNNQQMLIGEKGNFDIWDIASGKLMYKYHGVTPFSIPGVNGSIVFWSPDGKYLTMLAGKSSSIGDGVLSIWQIPSARSR